MSRARSAALGLVKAASVASDPLLGRRKGPRFLIYHQVGAGSGLEMDVDTESFEAQVDWLLANYRVVPLDEALENIGSDESDSDVVLTFDDGHRGVYTDAYPIMRESAVPFTLFLNTGPLESGSFLHDDPTMPLMSWANLEEMMSSGLATIGSHTHRHLNLRTTEPTLIAEDLELCDQIIERRLGIEVRAFAYPWGLWGAAADGSVRKRYTSAFVGSGGGIKDGADLHRLPRVPVMAGDNLTFFKRKMWGGFRLETLARGVRDGIRNS